MCVLLIRVFGEKQLLFFYCKVFSLHPKKLLLVDEQLHRESETLGMKLQLEPDLDTSEQSNYTPIFNLPLSLPGSSKTIYTTTIYLRCLSQVLGNNHSTETASLKVSNELLMAIHSDLFVLLLLDLSAAFDDGQPKYSTQKTRG